MDAVIVLPQPLPIWKHQTTRLNRIFLYEVDPPHGTADFENANIFNQFELVSMPWLREKGPSVGFQVHVPHALPYAFHACRREEAATCWLRLRSIRPRRRVLEIGFPQFCLS